MVKDQHAAPQVDIALVEGDDLVELEFCDATRRLTPEIPDAPKILLHNVYGWFDRAERGIYILTDAGRAALNRWPQQPIDFAGTGDSMA